MHFAPACLQVNHLETHDSFAEHARAAGLELVESLDKTTSMATHFQTLIEVTTLFESDGLAVDLLGPVCIYVCSMVV